MVAVKSLRMNKFSQMIDMYSSQQIIYVVTLRGRAKYVSKQARSMKRAVMK